MTGCPICERAAEKVRESSTFRVICLRCGPYFLGFRAEQLLENKWKGGKPEDVQLARARASHVIRSRTSDEQPLKIIDSDLEEIFSQSLPDPPTQVTNLIGYLKEQAGDAHLRTIDITDCNALLGVVGAADESALEKVMKWACRQGLVSLPDEDGNSVNLTPEAWEDSTSPKIGFSAD